MTTTHSRYSVNSSSNPQKGRSRRRLPIQVLGVFLLLIVFGIFLHSLTTYLFNSNNKPKLRPISTRKPASTFEEGPWSDSHLLNISSFDYIRNNDTICQTGDTQDANLQEKLLLVMVNSPRENYNERCTIRKAIQKMSASVTHKTEWTVRAIFLLGETYEPDNSAEKDAFLMEETFLSEEQAVYGDMVVGNFVDTLDNQTYKTIMGLKWALTYCRNAQFIVKMNDNAFFNIPKFVQWRNMEMMGLGNIPKLPELYCIPAKEREPTRMPSEKSSDDNRLLMSKSEWPENKFPDYCQGLLYGMTLGLAQQLYEVSHELGYLRLEDIFVTGMVLQRVQEKYGMVQRREIQIGQESEHTLRTICDKKVLRQTVSEEIGLAVELKRGTFMEKQMLCLAKEV